jgi:hypothetical protein
LYEKVNHAICHVCLLKFVERCLNILPRVLTLIFAHETKRSPLVTRARYYDNVVQDIKLETSLLHTVSERKYLFSFRYLFIIFIAYQLLSNLFYCNGFIVIIIWIT